MITNSKKISFILLIGISTQKTEIILKNYKKLKTCGLNSVKLNNFLDKKLIFNGYEAAIKDRIKHNRDLRFENNSSCIFCDGDFTLLNKFYSFLKIVNPSNIFIDCAFNAIKEEDSEKFRLDDLNIYEGWGYWKLMNALSNKKEQKTNDLKNSSNEFVFTILNASLSIQSFLKLDEKSPLHNIIRLYMEANDSDAFYVRIILYLSVLEMLNSNTGKDSITIKVARLPAVLLGFDLETSKVIYRNMTKVYGIRSEMVHEAKFEKATEEISNYLSNLISSIFLTLLCLDKIKIEKGESYTVALFKEVNSYGFGQRSSLVKALSSNEKVFLIHKKDYFSTDLFPPKKV